MFYLADYFPEFRATCQLDEGPGAPETSLEGDRIVLQLVSKRLATTIEIVQKLVETDLTAPSFVLMPPFLNPAETHRSFL